MTATATTVIKEILQHGHTNADGSTKTPLFTLSNNRSDQGDIYIYRFDSLKGFPELKESKPVYQLAPGSTRGSRHCLDQESVKEAKFYSLIKPNALQGPVWVNPNPTLLTHPEHGDQILPPGTYYVTYQRKYSEELKRVQD